MRGEAMQPKLAAAFFNELLGCCRNGIVLWRRTRTDRKAHGTIHRNKSVQLYRLSEFGFQSTLGEKHGNVVAISFYNYCLSRIRRVVK